MNSLKMLFAGFFVLVFLNGCGDASSGVSYTITGETIIENDECGEYTVTRSTPATASIILQPSLESGQGTLYVNSTCTTVAFLNVTISSGSSTAKFYFKNTNTGVTKLGISDITNQVVDAATLDVTVQ